MFPLQKQRLQGLLLLQRRKLPGLTVESAVSAECRQHW